VRRLVGELEATAGLGDSDAQEFYVVGLALRCLEDAAWKGWMDRALDAPDPVETAEHREAIRVVSEVARSADHAGEAPMLERAARRYIRLVRKKWARDPLLTGSENLNPVALLAASRIGAGDVLGAYDVFQEAGESVTGAAPRAVEQLRRRVTAEGLVREALGAGRDRVPLAEFILKHYRAAPAALRVLETGLSEGDAAYALRYALLAARQGEEEGALRAAREALLRAGPAEVRESLTLLAARLLLRNGQTGEAIEVLRPLAQGVTSRPAHAAELMDAAGADEEALNLYRQSEACGNRPNIQIARILERLSRLKEALQYYERDMEAGSVLAAWPHDEDLGVLPARPGSPETSREGRARVLRALESLEGR